MKSWIPRKSEYDSKKQATATALVAEALVSPGQPASQKPMPKYVANWLAQLRLLYGVPFEYLACDERYLPVESIRFFYIDRNWSDAMTDGALSIGSTSRDLMFKQSNLQTIAGTLDELENNVRNGLRGLPATSGSNSELVCGFLLRSSVVSGYPGMEVRGYADKEHTELLDILRLDRLSPNILFCLFAGKPADVEMQQPPEGMHFGVLKDQSPHDPNNPYFVLLRNISGDDVGMQIQPPKQATVYFREGADGVLDVTRSAQTIGQELALGTAPLLSAAFAIQMTRSAGLQAFTTGVPANNQPGNKDE